MGGWNFQDAREAGKEPAGLLAGGQVGPDCRQLSSCSPRQSRLDQVQGAREAGKEPAGLLAEKGGTFKVLHFPQMSYLGGRLVQTKDYFQPDPPVGW